MIISYTPKYSGLTITLKFNSEYKLKKFYWGKYYVKVTDCTLFINENEVKTSSVVKHKYDIDDPIFAYRLAAKKVLTQLGDREIRAQIWKVINEKSPINE